MSAIPEAPLRITPDMLLSRRVDFERRMSRVPPVTLVTLGLLAAIFVATLGMGALTSRESIIAWARSPASGSSPANTGGS